MNSSRKISKTDGTEDQPTQSGLLRRLSAFAGRLRLRQDSKQGEQSMSFQQFHFHLCPHPAPTSLTAGSYACAFAHYFGARLIVSSPRISVKAPAHWLAGQMIAGMARELETRAASKTTELEGHIVREAAALGVTVEIEHIVKHWPFVLGEISWHGRTSDLCILGLSRGDAEHRLIAEDWLFEVGRPCLFYPDDARSQFSLDRVMVCWDSSKAAARAVGDALPILRRAKQVRIATVRGEKDLPAGDLQARLINFLEAHGVSSIGDDVELEDRTIGQAILTHAGNVSANLIVMGAFGHSRMKEFWLGGATRDLLDRSPLPLFMSH